MDSTDTKHRPSWLGNIPRQFRPDDSHDFRLVGFPVNLLYSEIADRTTDKETANLLLMMCAFDPVKLLNDEQLRNKVRAVWYWCDPASYIEDDHKRQMEYRSRKSNPYSVSVMWNKVENRWETRKHKSDKLICLASGTDFNSAMMHTTLRGPEPDETLDTQ
jgi:hypothetical protein